MSYSFKLYLKKETSAKFVKFLFITIYTVNLFEFFESKKWKSVLSKHIHRVECVS